MLLSKKWLTILNYVWAHWCHPQYQSPSCYKSQRCSALRAPAQEPSRSTMKSSRMPPVSGKSKFRSSEEINLTFHSFRLRFLLLPILKKMESRYVRSKIFATSFCNTFNTFFRNVTVFENYFKKSHSLIYLNFRAKK